MGIVMELIKTYIYTINNVSIKFAGVYLIK